MSDTILTPEPYNEWFRLDGQDMFAYKKHKYESKGAVQRKESEMPVVKPNLTGIPDGMKTRFENLSGLSFDDIRVHYNSNKPAQLQALAYTQGNQVHIAQGQEKHLAHELGHVIQQKQNKPRPMLQMGNIRVNNDPFLEKEASNLADRADLESAAFLADRLRLHNAPSASDTLVQMMGERSAIGSTMAVQRGNVEQDVYSTGGLSYAKLMFSRDIVDEITAMARKRPALATVDSLSIRERLSRYLRVGNCGEFSLMTFQHLRKNTLNQWVYYCVMNTPKESVAKHVFTITSSVQINQGGKIANDADLDLTIVVDAWNSFKTMPLRQFLLPTGNPEATAITLDNIRIQYEAKAGDNAKNIANTEAAIDQILPSILTDSYVKEKLKNKAGLISYASESSESSESIESLYKRAYPVAGVTGIYKLPIQNRITDTRSLTLMVNDMDSRELAQHLKDNVQQHKNIFNGLTAQNLVNLLKIVPTNTHSGIFNGLTAQNLVNLLKIVPANTHSGIFNGLTAQNLANLLIIVPANTHSSIFNGLTAQNLANLLIIVPANTHSGIFNGLTAQNLTNLLNISSQVQRGHIFNALTVDKQNYVKTIITTFK